eukprot:10333796-Alexandrium_andersonii.AAC.1
MQRAVTRACPDPRQEMAAAARGGERRWATWQPTWTVADKDGRAGRRATKQEEGEGESETEGRRRRRRREETGAGGAARAGGA